MGAVNTELGLTATAAISLNDAAVRGLFGVASGAISMSGGYGKSSRKAIAITIGANTQNYVLNTAKASGYSTGKSDVTLTINAGVYVGATSTGVYALDVDTSWAAGDTVKIVNNGYIIGCGGSANGGGGTGGPALRAQRATTVTNSGTIGGGGGGGGYGQYVYGLTTTGTVGQRTAYGAGGGGGGGGAGYNAGTGGGPVAPLLVTVALPAMRVTVVMASYQPAAQVGQAE